MKFVSQEYLLPYHYDLPKMLIPTKFYYFCTLITVAVNTLQQLAYDPERSN